MVTGTGGRVLNGCGDETIRFVVDVENVGLVVYVGFDVDVIVGTG